MDSKEVLRNKFFKECTQRDSIDGVKFRIDIAPHDLFEWFVKNMGVLNNNSDGENWEQKCRELQKHNSELWEAFGNFCQAVNDQFNKNIQFMPPPLQQTKI